MCVLAKGDIVIQELLPLLLDISWKTGLIIL